MFTGVKCYALNTDHIVYIDKDDRGWTSIYPMARFYLSRMRGLLILRTYWAGLHRRAGLHNRMTATALQPRAEQN